METPTIPPGLTPNEILHWSSAQVQPRDSDVFQQPPPPPPPTGTPTETNYVQWTVKLEDTDIALTTPPTSVVIGSVFLINEEYMTVNSVDVIDNPGVARSTHGSDIAVHEAGAAVDIWAPDTPPATQGAGVQTQSAKAGKSEPRFETKREEAKREKKEEEEEDDR